MFIYKMLIKNRIREYMCLLKNMMAPILTLLIVLLIGGYQISTIFFPLLKEIEQVNRNILLLLVLLLIGRSFYHCFLRVKPLFVLKPITLHLLQEEGQRKLIWMQYVWKILMHLLKAYILAICVGGVFLNRDILSILLCFFWLLETTDLLSWQMYHSTEKKHSKYLLLLWVIITLSNAILYLVIPPRYYVFWGIANSIIWGVLLKYTLHKLKWNREKYEDEMRFREKILVAQNHNNTVLLSQYAKEKKLRTMKHSRADSKFMSRKPLIWKTKTSIFRLEKLRILIGVGIFGVTVCIHKVPIFWSLSVLELEEIRDIMLCFGVFALMQFMIQSMLQQLGSMLEKEKDGLFLPFTEKELLIQFAAAPMMVVLVIIGALTIILESTLLQATLATGIMLILIVTVFYLQIKNKELLVKGYFIVSILLLLCSFLLMF